VGRCQAGRWSMKPLMDVVSAPSPYPRRHRLRINPQAFLALSRFLLQPFQHRIPRRILSIPPAPAVFDECVVDIGAIKEEHISQGAPVLVVAVGLKRDFSP